jgi:hypothetical protein
MSASTNDDFFPHFFYQFLSPAPQPIELALSITPVEVIVEDVRWIERYVEIPQNHLSAFPEPVFAS